MARNILGRIGLAALVIAAAALLCSFDPVGFVGWADRGTRPGDAREPVDPARADGAGRRWRERHQDPEDYPGFVGPPRPAQMSR